MSLQNISDFPEIEKIFNAYLYFYLLMQLKYNCKKDKIMGKSDNMMIVVWSYNLHSNVTKYKVVFSQTDKLTNITFAQLYNGNQQSCQPKANT